MVNYTNIHTNTNNNSSNNMQQPQEQMMNMVKTSIYQTRRFQD